MPVASIYLGRLHRLDLDRLYHNVNLLYKIEFFAVLHLCSHVSRCMIFALAEPFVKRSFVEIVRATAGY
jgi:hypothetical protein